MILNVHVSVMLVLFILEHLCLPRDLNVHLSVVLVLFILEHLCLPCNCICTCTSVVGGVHSGVAESTPNFKCTCTSVVGVVHSGAPVFTP